LQEIEQVIKNIGEKEKYSFVLEKNQAGILFSTPSIDVTDKVIAAFNESSKKKAPAAPAPAKK
jgi:Skp family chaperone for outer membrane proteins